jgi:hypothetical protein
VRAVNNEREKREGKSKEVVETEFSMDKELEDGLWISDVEFNDEFEEEEDFKDYEDM